MALSKKIAIAIVCILFGLPALIAALVIIGLFFFNNSKPDNSKDTLIPQDYIEFDGQQSYGGGDWDEIAYYVYEQQPQLDGVFQRLDTVNGSEIQQLISGYPLSTADNDNPRLEHDYLLQCLSEGDYYYVSQRHSHGALFYYYDIQTKTLYKIDYRF